MRDKVMNYKAIVTIIFGGCIQASGSAVLKFATSMLKSQDYNIISCVFGFIAAILLFCCGFPLYSRGLSKLKISIAQPVFSSTMFLVSTLISLLFFKDKLAVHQFAGLFTIIAGVIVVISSTDPVINLSDEVNNGK
jgi:Membrane transporters of cations and cationic drugs